jgi:intracellular sulfur oxidation DsrE/DsrF family protein
MYQIKILITVMLCMASVSALAQLDSFHAGKTIAHYGQIATVEGMNPIPKESQFKISFDVSKPAAKGEVNRLLDSAARFINMHTAAGIPMENINLAVVVHGGAVKDMAKSGDDYAHINAELIEALSEHGVHFYVCGQSAAYYGVKTGDLLPGVTMSLSAMTAHALLQQQGYTLNPF